MSRLKIVFHLNSLEQGGAERVVTTLANCLIEKYDIIIATMWNSLEEYPIDSRISRVSVGLSREQEKKGRITRIFYRNYNLRRIIKKEKPDILISFAKKANYRALIATLGTKVPVIVSVRTNPYVDYGSFIDKVLIRLLYPLAAGSVFQTKGAKEFFSSNIQKNSQIILNPINPQFIDVKGPTERKKEVVQSGRIVYMKNQNMLIEAFTLVHQKHSDFILKLYGTDSKDGTWEKLEKCIKKNHAESYVFLMGGSNQLEKDLVNASVFAFSSDWEGLPNSLMEAMALGLPVVATDCPCGGPATLIKNRENGVLVPINDKVAMAEAICDLIENQALAEKIGNNARKIAKIANSEMICKQWQDYILYVLKSKNN